MARHSYSVQFHEQIHRKWLLLIQASGTCTSCLLYTFITLNFTVSGYSVKSMKYLRLEIWCHAVYAHCTCVDHLWLYWRYIGGDGSHIDKPQRRGQGNNQHADTKLVEIHWLSFALTRLVARVAEFPSDPRDWIPETLVFRAIPGFTSVLTNRVGVMACVRA